MLLKKRISLVIILLTFGLSYAQVPVGAGYDLNGIPLNGYYDPMTYSPQKKLTQMHNSDSYEIGYYYDMQGNRVDGIIKFENDKIFYKKYKADFRIKLRPEEVKSLRIGVDSFFVVSNFYFKNRVKTTPEFVQYIAEVNGFVFAKHYHFTSGMGQQYGGRPPIIESFLVKKPEGNLWENFPDNGLFKDKALSYFQHIPYLEDKISSGEYDNDDMLSMIKMAEYFEKFQKAEPIFYDKYWQEVRDMNQAEYVANIVDNQDSIWTFEYFKGSAKLYKAHYVSFYPNKKHGEFTAYYPGGKVRRVVDYTNDKRESREVKTFDKQGSLKMHYVSFENETEYEDEKDIGLKYLSVINADGNNILKSAESRPHIKYKDEFSNITYTQVFEKNELSYVYRLQDQDTVFQIVDPGFPFKIRSLQKRFSGYMFERDYDKALSENAQGTILISVLIDKKGYAQEASVLNSIHPEIDRLVNGFIETKLLPTADFRYKFKPYKRGRIKRYSEVVIPIEFGINKFYRRPVNYYNNYYNWHWQHQQMMMMNNFTPPTPPPMPRAF